MGIQPGRTSRKLHTIAISIVCRVCPVFVNLTEWFIHLVLEEVAPVGHPAEHVIKTGNDEDPDMTSSYCG
jgi:hypothetical protein